MALHDACDVLMEAAKAFNYLDRDAAATAAFAAFLVSWAVLRLGALPAVVIRSAVRELPAALGGRPLMWWGFCGGLLLLLALHVYWFTLIVRVAWMRVVTGGGRDLREDD
jgi:ceramide synthetase